MDIRMLKNFLILTETKNITRAAERIHIAQPPLSRQLQALERELGVSLFVRSNRGMTLTEAGELLKSRAQQLVELSNRTKDQLWEMQHGVTGTLYIGAIETVGTAYLPQWIADFKVRYPDVKYNLWSANTDDVLERMDKCLMDVALIRDPFDTDKYDSIHIKNEKWIAILQRGHHLASDEVLTLEQLADESLIVPTRRSGEIRAWFEEVGLKAEIFCEFAPLMNAVVLAESGLGIAVCPQSAAGACENRAVVIRDILPEKENGVYLVWKKEGFMTHISRMFIEYIAGLKE